MKLTEAQARELGIIPPPKKKRSPYRDRTQRSKGDGKDGRDKLFDAQCKANGLPCPVKEFQFCPGRKWAFDYLFGDSIALEIEGGMFGKGSPCPACGRREVAGHSSIERIKKDMAKYNEAASRGFLVIRCLPEDIASGSVFPILRRAMQVDE